MLVLWWPRRPGSRPGPAGVSLALAGLAVPTRSRLVGARSVASESLALSDPTAGRRRPQPAAIGQRDSLPLAAASVP